MPFNKADPGPLEIFVVILIIIGILAFAAFAAYALLREECKLCWAFICRCIRCRSSAVRIFPEEACANATQTAAMLSTNMPPPLELKVCRLNHELIRMRFAGITRKKKICSSCGCKVSWDEQFYKCKQKCNFVICERCHYIAPGRSLKYPSCASNHPLVFSKYRGRKKEDKYFGGKYQCAVCSRQKYCEAGRYFCTYCLVDVCANCQINYELPGLFEAIQ